jgi:hypothetical protein
MNSYIYGLHDPGGENLMMVDGIAKGWVLVTEEIGANPKDNSSKDYRNLNGFGVIVRLNHAYGPNGTIPLQGKYNDFAHRVANFVFNSQGCHIWIIGNEMNMENEQPRKADGSNHAEPITPRRYATCYKSCRDAIHALSEHSSDQVLMGAIAPWNAQTPYEADPGGQYRANKIPGAPADYPYNGFFGDYIFYLHDILVTIDSITDCDGIAIHAYTHGTDPGLIFSNTKMGAPFANYNYHFRTYIDQMKIIPLTMRHLPVYLTEMDQDQAWEDVNKGWVKNAYSELNSWNVSNQQIRAAILYRWSKADKWNIDGKQGVQNDFKDAIAMNYQWNDESMADVPAIDCYQLRVDYLKLKAKYDALVNGIKDLI